MFEKWTTYTNLKAVLANADQASSIYSNFKPFVVDEIERFIGLFIFHGLSSSPWIDIKFNPQSMDPINRNDFVSKCFSTNALQRYKHFKYFFTLADSRKPNLSKAVHPNYKVDEI